jgi:hypothetical protein
MAFQFYEKQETRGFSDSGGKKTASRKFTVWDDTTAIETPSIIRDQMGVTLPAIGDKFPDEKVVYAVSYSIEHIAGSRNTWDFTVNYENTEPSTYLPQEEGYTEITIDYAIEFRDIWRTGTSSSSHSAGIPVTPGGDVGGQKIDKAGEPLSILVRMSDITIKETVSAASFPARSQGIRAARGRRNLTPFQGAVKGEVLYTGASASRVGLEKFSITHKFRQDEVFHMLQSARRNQLGKVETSPDAQQVHRASNVEYIQPFPSFYDFNTLSENF